MQRKLCCHRYLHACLLISQAKMSYNRTASSITLNASSSRTGQKQRNRYMAAFSIKHFTKTLQIRTNYRFSTHNSNLPLHITKDKQAPLVRIRTELTLHSPPTRCSFRVYAHAHFATLLRVFFSLLAYIPPVLNLRVLHRGWHYLCNDG